MSSRRRLIDEKEIKRIAEEERQQRIRDHDRIRASSQKTIEERKKIREADFEEQKRKNKEIIAEREKEMKQRNEEHQRVMKEHRQFMKELRQFMEENKKQSELTIEKIRKSSEQIEAIQKFAKNEELRNKFIVEHISYLQNCLGVLKQELKVKPPPRNNIEWLIETVKKYISELNEIKNMSISDKLNNSYERNERNERLDTLKDNIDKLEKVFKQPTDTPATGGSKLPVKRRAKPKAKPKAKPRSNKGVR